MHDLPGVRPLVSATWLNPSAGHHVVTADARELAATERAGERSWSRWTYYSRRYGERGRLFTRSDSGWIATLAGDPVPDVERQIRWLGGLLAGRGMPRLLLEEHLEFLHEELSVAVPERAGDYAVLQQAANSLRDERNAYMADQVLAALETQFRDMVVGTRADDLRAGALIGAAVADERANIPGSVESLTQWLADPARFPQQWREAVEQTLQQARQTALNARAPNPPRH